MPALRMVWCMTQKQITQVSTQLGYDLWSPNYDSENNPLVALDESALPALLPDVHHKQVLELGCGTGRVTHRLLAAKHILALDVSEGMLSIAKRRLNQTHIQFEQRDLDQPWGLSDTHFQVLVSALVLEHIGDLNTFFHQAYELASPHATFIISTMHPAMFLIQKQAHFYDEATQTEVRFESHPHQISHMYSAAKDAGWRLVDLRELVVDETHMALSSKLGKFNGWPMWLGMTLKK